MEHDTTYVTFVREVVNVCGKGQVFRHSLKGPNVSITLRLDFRGNKRENGNSDIKQMCHMRESTVTVLILNKIFSVTEPKRYEFVL